MAHHFETQMLARLLTTNQQSYDDYCFITGNLKWRLIRIHKCAPSLFVPVVQLFNAVKANKLASKWIWSTSIAIVKSLPLIYFCSQNTVCVCASFIWMFARTKWIVTSRWTTSIMWTTVNGIRKWSFPVRFFSVRSFLSHSILNRSNGLESWWKHVMCWKSLLQQIQTAQFMFHISYFTVNVSITQKVAC